MVDAELLRSAQDAARLLQARRLRLVLAESCTAGLAAAALGQMPGISEYLCGSAVTYRNRTKEEWLNIPAADLADPGPVSALVTEAMARAVLQITTEADLSLAVTGHLGPGAPPALDGLIFIAVGQRSDGGPRAAAEVRQHRLRTGSRMDRQQEAAQLALDDLREVLSARR